MCCFDEVESLETQPCRSRSLEANHIYCYFLTAPDASSINISVDIHDVPGMDVVDELTTALIKKMNAYSDSKQKIDFLLAFIQLTEKKTL